MQDVDGLHPDGLLAGLQVVNRKPQRSTRTWSGPVSPHLRLSCPPQRAAVGARGGPENHRLLCSSLNICKAGYSQDGAPGSPTGRVTCFLTHRVGAGGNTPLVVRTGRRTGSQSPGAGQEALGACVPPLLPSCPFLRGSAQPGQVRSGSVYQTHLKYKRL